MVTPSSSPRCRRRPPGYAVAVPAPARYFPVDAGPLRMQAGLQRFPVELGNGPADRRFFQRDDEHPRYVAAKAKLVARGDAAGRRHAVSRADRGEDRAHAAVLTWIDATLARELEAPPLSPEAPLSAYDLRLRDLQEDAAVIYRDPSGHERAILVSVYFPSGWRPETILGASFASIHAPVPDFADHPKAAVSMVRAMIERGPYLRFVWTVCADDELDHHPEHGRRTPWSAATGGFLRVERQLTIPFPEVDASLFLIRTYLYPFASLDGAQRSILARAVAAMPTTIRRYKGLEGHEATIARLLRAA